MSEETKVCKHCQSEIPKKAKVCPNCRKKQGGKLKWIIIVVIVIAVAVGAAGGGKDEKDNQKTQTGKENAAGDKNTAKEETKEPEIEYTACSVDEMMKALDENAMNAASTYDDKYLEVTGVLSNIDSNGKYIDLLPAEDEFAFIGVQCYIKSDEQKEAIAKMAKGDTVTVRGKCTDVGEIFGYSINIDSVVQP